MNHRKFEITAADILPLADYIKVRHEKKKSLVALKKHRRVEIGPVATAYFESYETMLHQIQEMLFIEKGGEEQLKDELLAYNPLVPKGNELVATVMFEIDNPDRRQKFLSNIGGIEETMFIQIGDLKIKGVPEEDLDRTTADGKASAVQFIHFPFTQSEIAAFRTEGNNILIGFEHSSYAHMTILTKATQTALAADFKI